MGYVLQHGEIAHKRVQLVVVVINSSSSRRRRRRRRNLVF